MRKKGRRVEEGRGRKRQNVDFPFVSNLGMLWPSAEPPTLMFRLMKKFLPASQLPLAAQAD